MYKKALRFIFNGVEPVSDTVCVSPLIQVQGLYQVYLVSNITLLILPCSLFD